MPASRGPITFSYRAKFFFHFPSLSLSPDVSIVRLLAVPRDMATLTDDHGTLQPVCQNCQTSTTPLWRRDEIGSVLCNACGLFLKLHGRPRPISLKTDVIKSRNRVKSAGQSHKKRVREDNTR